MRNRNTEILGLLFFVLIALWACKSTSFLVGPSSVYRAESDDRTLFSNKAPYIMPYNRILDPAGISVSFGDGNFENHSLDARVLPDQKSIVVEDRYGIATFDIKNRKIVDRWSFNQDATFSGAMSSYSGISSIVYHDSTFIFWGAGGKEVLIGRERYNSYVMQAYYDYSSEKKIKLVHVFPFHADAPATIALPNQVIPKIEEGELVFYTVLNGSNKIVKVNVRSGQITWTAATGMAPFGLEILDDKAYVTNWAGPLPDSSDGLETAGIPWGKAYVDPATGAMNRGSVSVFDLNRGTLIHEIPVGLHPNAILGSPDKNLIYVANGNSDDLSVISTQSQKVIDTIFVGLLNTQREYIGSTPNALAFNQEGNLLFVANGMDNAIGVIDLKDSSSPKKYHLKGYIPTEAYPSGIAIYANELIVTNLESTGARAMTQKNGVPLRRSNASKDTRFNSHHQEASISFIPLPDDAQLKNYTAKVKQLSMDYRLALTEKLPRPGILPKPVPERIGEPSVFKHVLYIIKENRTYDQVLGDMPEGRGLASLCIFGNTVTPNQHQLARDFVLLDNYHVSGKSSAEGHHWANAGIVTDYTEKMVRAWFRSYPHVLYDAMVYDKNGLIWNNALDHGKSVRIYGEACTFNYDRTKYNWKYLWQLREHGLLSQFNGSNTTTISRVRPVLDPSFPGGDDLVINDQMRADAFIQELQEIESKPDDQLPNLMIMSLPSDHTAGTSPGFPKPQSMVADNDLAVGRIVEAVMNSRFADSTVIFISEDDSQAGWDHISAYRTTGFIISNYSTLKKTITTNYNQSSMLRTMEQILGLPPMNVIDATALPMFDCFGDKINHTFKFKTINNNIPLDEMNPPRETLQGINLKHSDQSVKYSVHLIDRGHDDILNRILWHSVKGNQSYPGHFAGDDDGDE